jgi:hypothetical protein
MAEVPATGLDRTRVAGEMIVGVITTTVNGMFDLGIGDRTTSALFAYEIIDGAEIKGSSEGL